MKTLFIPGVSIAIVQKGRVVYAEGSGVRKVWPPGLRHANDSLHDRLFHQAVNHSDDGAADRQGPFTWSTAVRELLPDFALAEPENYRKLEMRHTVCACTGMPRRDVDFLFKLREFLPNSGWLK